MGFRSFSVRVRVLVVRGLGLWSRVQGLEFRLLSKGLRMQGSGVTVYGFRFWGVRCRVQGVWFTGAWCVVKGGG